MDVKPKTTDIDFWADKLMDRINSISANDQMQEFSMRRAHIKEILSLYGQEVSDATRIQQTREIMECLPINQQ